MSDFIRQQQVRARKEHTCDFCGSPILRGCEYRRIVFRDGGSVSEYVSHIHCDAIINDYETSPLYDGYFDPEEVIEYFCEKACTGCPDHLGYDEDCGRDPLCCEQAIQKALHPTIVAAALESIRKNRKEEAE